MATIRTRITKKNDEKYHVVIRKKGIDICKTFSVKEDAELYTKWKENLIDLMDNFEVDIKDTITIEALFDLKIKSVAENNKRTYSDIFACKRTVLDYFHDKKFASDINFDEWKNFAISIYDKDVYRGAKSGGNVRKISIHTLKKLFAYCSASYSYAQSQGIELENHPLRVIQTFITPLKSKA